MKLLTSSKLKHNLLSFVEIWSLIHDQISARTFNYCSKTLVKNYFKDNTPSDQPIARIFGSGKNVVIQCPVNHLLKLADGSKVDTTANTKRNTFKCKRVKPGEFAYINKLNQSFETCAPDTCPKSSPVAAKITEWEVTENPDSYLLEFAFEREQFRQLADDQKYDPKNGWTMALMLKPQQYDLDPETDLFIYSPNAENLNLDTSGQFVTLTSNSYNFDLRASTSRGKLAHDQLFKFLLHVRTLNNAVLPNLKFKPVAKFFNGKFTNLACLLNDQVTAARLDGSKFVENLELAPVYFSHYTMSQEPNICSESQKQEPDSESSDPQIPVSDLEIGQLTDDDYCSIFTDYREFYCQEQKKGVWTWNSAPGAHCQYWYTTANGEYASMCQRFQTCYANPVMKTCDAVITNRFDTTVDCSTLVGEDQHLCQRYHHCTYTWNEETGAGCKNKPEGEFTTDPTRVEVTTESLYNDIPDERGRYTDDDWCYLYQNKRDFPGIRKFEDFCYRNDQGDVLYRTDKSGGDYCNLFSPRNNPGSESEMAFMCHKFRSCDSVGDFENLAQFVCDARVMTRYNRGYANDDMICSFVGEYIPEFCDGSNYTGFVPGLFCPYLTDDEGLSICAQAESCEYLWDRKNGASCKTRVFLPVLPVMPSDVIPVPEKPEVPVEYALPSFGTQFPTTSGFSSGAFLSAALNIVHSATFKGYGGTGGGAYFWDPEVMAKMGKIDPLSNLMDKRVILHHGINDTTVEVKEGYINADFWQNAIGLSEDQLNVDYLGTDNGHTVPSIYHEGYGVENLSENYPGYDWSVSVICWLYPDLNCLDSGIPSRGGSALNVISKAGFTGELKTFSQEEFCYEYADQTCSDIYMSPEGHYYVPEICADKNSNCKLHFVLHGCTLTALNVGTEYMTRLTMFELADKFGIVMVIPSSHNYELGYDLSGCWNNEGYLGTGFSAGTQDNPQFKVIKGMVDRMMAPYNYVPEEKSFWDSLFSN